MTYVEPPKPVGPYTVWVDYGYEGWKPTDYPTLREALEAEKYSYRWVITKPASYTVTDDDEAAA